MLWLAGWYPTNENPFAGDFIQRHFKAFYNSDKFEGSNESLHLIHLAANSNFRLREFWNVMKELKDENCEFAEFVIPVFQSKFILFKPVNFLWYYIVGIYVLSSYFRTHSTNYVHLHAADKVGYLATTFKELKGFNLYYTEHWAIFDNDAPDSYNQRNTWFRYYFKQVWEKTDLYVSISESMYQSMAKTYSEEREYIVVPNILDQVFEADIESKLIPTEEINVSNLRILHISNFEQRKNIPLIIEAFNEFQKHFPGATLTLVGGALESNNRLDLTSVFVYPKMPVQDLIPHYRNSDIFLMYSDSENAPCVITEALCYGLPVISNDVGSISEMLTAENGIVIKRNSENLTGFNHLFNALLEFTQKSQIFDKIEISKKAISQYGMNRVFKDFYWIK